MLRTILKKQTQKVNIQLQENYAQYKTLLHGILEVRNEMQYLMRQFNQEPTQQLCYELEQLIEMHDGIRSQFFFLEEQNSKFIQPQETLKLYKEQYVKYTQVRQILREYFNHQLCM